MIDLTAEQTYLLTLMGYALKGKQLDTVDAEADWMTLIQEAKAQSVSMLLFDVISGTSGQIPEDAYQKIFKHARRGTAGNLRMEYAQMDLVSVLEEKGYPYVILKGQTAAAYYPNPSLRLLGDVDFLVPESLTETVAQEMQALQYAHSWEPGDYHQVLQKNGACLELHMQLAGMPKGKAKVPVEKFFADIYERSVWVGTAEHPYRAPCPEHHGMILLLHMQHHVVSHGMGLRHIMDWACFVEKTCEDAFWDKRLIPLLKQIGLYRFAAVFTKMASLYLGSTCPAWAADTEESVCSALMQDIMNGGNFGRKDADRSRSVNMIPDWEEQKKQSRFRLLWKTLGESAEKSHPRLCKNAVGRLLAMAGRTLRYLVLFCAGKRPNLLKAANHAEQRRSVYEQLHMYEPQK